MKQNRTILVVDDEPDILELIVKYLIEMGYSGIKAPSGEDALIILEDNTDIDCILLDMMMPGLSGLEVLEIVRKNPATEDIPVIMVTAISQILKKKDAFSLGVNDYIVKPFDFEELSLRISTHIRLADAIRNEQALNKKLNAINEELRNFAYIVSHDLKAPLRGITALADWIDDDIRKSASEETLTNLTLLKKRVNRMNNLIEGTLQYSRLGRAHTPVEDVDSGLLVDSVFQSLKAPPNIHMSRSGEFPVLIIEKVRLVQIFENLIENAIRFMDKPEGLIKISVIPAGIDYQFTVQDNGPGIEPRYHEKIFQIFQTLHSRDEFESTGIGLTLVAKIINLYGGEIKVLSESGKGSSFIFTLPSVISPEALGEKNPC